ncbi:hypothetical protein [Streptomyces sp. SCSIO ZS0520]|uniref:hypothetical protein n=1 Tax=Streptomyces sp. SCSIO ZS0520 TaxID=2892996 RepID=UPI0021DB1494|nr:hypothetical protein [Streptomyces sp. SCSIO ZS0520]
MRLPADWSASRASGWFSLHHLTHDPCGWTSRMAYDLWAERGPFGEADARQVVYGHSCEEADRG